MVWGRRERARLIAQRAVIGDHGSRHRVERPVRQVPRPARRQLVLRRLAPLGVLLATAPARAQLRRLEIRLAHDDAARVQIPHDHLAVLLVAHGHEEPLVRAQLDRRHAVVVLLEAVDLGARLKVPHHDVAVLPLLPRHDVLTRRRERQARHRVVVPAQERLLVRVAQVGDHDAAALRVNDIVAVRVDVQRRLGAAVEANHVLEFKRHL
eukprot:3276343-Prymnesium_polylepis.1